MNDLVQKFMSSWTLIVIHESGLVLQGGSIPGQEVVAEGKKIQDVCPWFLLEWLTNPSRSRLIEGAKHKRLLLEIHPKDHNEYCLLFRNVSDYRSVEHLLCEVTDEVISIQKFIDTFYDGVFISDGYGNILVVNDSWC